MPHEVHTSERRSFRGCRRRWNWIFRENWYPVVTAKPLEFGVAYHKAMEVYYDPTTWSMDREIVENLAVVAFEQKCQAQKQAYVDAGFELDDDVRTDYEERIALGVGMLRYYFSKAPTFDRAFKPVKVEVAFKVPIKDHRGNTLLCRCSTCYEEWRMGQAPVETYTPGSSFEGLPVYYAGRIDALVIDRDGKLWIVDWKTARALSQTQEFLDLDDQIASYVWALEQCGLDVRGFMYHEQKKAFPEQPKENSSRRLGCLYSVSKSQNTDLETYEAFVKEHDTEAYENGSYDVFLEYLRNEGIKYYQRFAIHKTDYQLRQIGQNIYLEASEMIDERTRIYPSPGRFSCSFCAFRQPCLGMNAGEDYQYTLESMFEKRQHYYVREEASTESKGGE